MKIATVTLKRKNETYEVVQIRGNRPVVAVNKYYTNEPFETRVGDVLTEEQVHKLGGVAELIVRGA